MDEQDTAPKHFSEKRKKAWNAIPYHAEDMRQRLENELGVPATISKSDTNFGRSWYVRPHIQSYTENPFVVRLSDHSANQRFHQMEARINLMQSGPGIPAGSEMHSDENIEKQKIDAINFAKKYADRNKFEDGGSTSGITAYHGSPHEFDKFDLSEINEKSSHGQNFGHGLYFAENEPTAFEYKKPSFALDSDPQGHMYEVHIDAHPDHFLDWDKPLSEQLYILKAIDQHIGDPQSVIERLSPTGSSNITGQELYEAMGGQHKASAVSQRLHEMGIHGIKYVDYKARGNWNPETGNYENSKHNYVVFDHDRVNIKRRYAEGGEVEREGFGFGGDTVGAGSRPERGATGSASAARAAREAPQPSYRDMPEHLQQAQRDLSFKNEQVINAMKESNAAEKQNKAEQMTAWANAGFPSGGPDLMQVGEETRPTAYAMSDISKKSPVMQSQADIIASILPPTTPNVGMGMSGRIGPESTTVPNIGMGMSGRISPESTTPNVAMGMPGRISPEAVTAPNIAMGMPGRIGPASTTAQAPAVVASTLPTANQQNALVLPGQKTFNRPSGVPMPPIPDRDLGAGSLLDTVLKPFGMDTNSWLDNKSSEYIKQGMMPSNAYTKASYDLRDLQMSNKQNTGQGGRGRRLVKKLMPDGTYQDVWEEYAHGGVAKSYATPHNSAIIEHALGKVGAPPPAFGQSLSVAKRGRPL